MIAVFLVYLFSLSLVPIKVLLVYRNCCVCCVTLCQKAGIWSYSVDFHGNRRISLFFRISASSLGCLHSKFIILACWFVILVHFCLSNILLSVTTWLCTLMSCLFFKSVEHDSCCVCFFVHYLFSLSPVPLTRSYWSIEIVVSVM